MELLLLVEADPEIISAVMETDHADVQVGERRPTTSTVDVLDSPIGVGEIKDVAEVVALIISSAGGLVTLVGQLRRCFRRPRPDQDALEIRFVIRDGRTNEPLITVTSESELAAVEQLAST